MNICAKFAPMILPFLSSYCIRVRIKSVVTIPGSLVEAGVMQDSSHDTLFEPNVCNRRALKHTIGWHQSRHVCHKQDTVESSTFCDF